MRRGSVRANLLANYVGSGLTALMAVAMSPVYLHLLGKEAFGLVALFNTLTALAALFEFGITAAVSRQMAQMGDSRTRGASEAAATLELLFTAIGIALGIALCAGGPAVAVYWLNPESLDHSTIAWSMLWLGIGFACRWNIAYYAAGLNGLERQIGLNLVTVLSAVVQYLGVVVVLWWCGATLPVFFAYLAGCGLLQMLVLRHLMWRLVGWEDGYRRWSTAVLGQWRSFAGGMALIAVASTLLTQADKILLSRLMPLAQFGVYSFASNTAAGTGRIIGPVFNAVYPRLTSLVAAGDRPALMGFYQLSAQVVACLLVPGVCAAAWFAGPLLRVWTRNPELAAEVEPLLRWFLLGNMLNALMHVPYALQLANGWTSLVFWTNFASLIVLVPAGFLAYHAWGPVGVVWVWFLLNAAYVSGLIPLMHRRVGWAGMGTWYLRGVLIPIAVAAAVPALFAWWSAAAPDALRVLAAALAVLASTACLVLASPAVRGLVLAWFSARRTRAAGAAP